MAGTSGGGRWERLRGRLGRAAKRPNPLVLVLGATAPGWQLAGDVGVGLGGGLPHLDGWDNDGVAPRDFLAGLVETFTPGSYFNYPPVHLLLLGLVTSPSPASPLARPPRSPPRTSYREILKVPYMTAIAYVAASSAWR